jgi:hypothetical protein
MLEQPEPAYIDPTWAGQWAAELHQSATYDRTDGRTKVFRGTESDVDGESLMDGAERMTGSNRNEFRVWVKNFMKWSADRSQEAMRWVDDRVVYIHDVSRGKARARAVEREFHGRASSRGTAAQPVGPGACAVSARYLGAETVDVGQAA